VAVLPEVRQRGIGHEMMLWSLAEMKRRGHALAALYAFRESYYRRLGYEVVGRRFKLTVPQHRLPRLDVDMLLRQLTTSDLHLLDPCYREFGRKVAGVNHRTAHQWNQRMGKTPPLIYAVGDPVQAYAWVSFEGTFWEPLTVGEFVYSSIESYRNLLGALAGLCINRSALVWYEPSTGPYLTRYLDQGSIAALERPAMFRVLDVPAALRCLLPLPGLSGEFTFEVDDPQMPENSGPWRVIYDADGVIVTRCDEAALHFDVPTFTQALLGEPSLTQLMSEGWVRVDDPRQSAAAEALLYPQPVCLLDFF
jgi:predicted acetyltransferase